MKWTDELDGKFNGNPCKIRVGVSETYSESDYNKNLREQRVNNVVKDYGNFDRPKVGSISVDDLLNDGIPSFRDFASNEEWVIWCNLLEKYEHAIDNIQQNAQIIDTIPNELFFSESFNYSLKEEIIRIIQDYEIARKDNSNLAPLSREALNSFLLIIPILSCYSFPIIHIDSTNGNINIDITQNPRGVLNIQIVSNRLIYFSYVGENSKIFKFTGTFKLKNNFDLIELNRLFHLL